MKKRWIPVLCAILLTVTLPAMAYYTLSYTFPEKITQHLTLSGYKLEGTVALEGEGMQGEAGRIFDLLKGLGADSFFLEGSGERTTKNNSFTFSLRNGEKEIKKLVYQRSGTVLGFSLDGHDGIFGFDRDSALFVLGMAAGLPGEVFLPFFVNDTATQALSPALGTYGEELGIWLSDYCKVEATAEGSVLRYDVPAKSLLEYAARLGDRLAGDGKAADALNSWLATCPAFSDIAELGGARVIPQVLRQMKPEGSVTIERVFNVAAERVSTEIVFPFDELTGIDRMTLILTSGEAGEIIDCTLELPDGNRSRLCLEKAGDSTVRGQVENFSVDGEALAFAFEFSMAYGRLKDDPVQNVASQDLTLSLSLTPLSGEDGAAQANCEIRMHSGRTKTDRLYVEGELTLKETDGDSCVTVTFSGETEKAFTFENMDPDSVIRLDRMDAGSIRDTVSGLLE